MDELWWGTIPNAIRFINDIVERIENEESVIYNIDSYFPWNDTFIRILKEKTICSQKTFKIIYDSDTDLKCPGEFIKDKYFKQELKNRYRTSIGYERFIAENDADSVLRKQYVLIKCNDIERCKQWCDFVAGYLKYHDDSEKCSFIIENCTGTPIKPSFNSFSSSDYFCKYDIDIFTLLITSSDKSVVRKSDIIKRYVSELASMIAGPDIEFAGYLALYGERLAFHTDFVVKEVIKKETRSNGSSFEVNKELNKTIRSAQIKIFYPEIENFRTNFIEKYADYFPTLSKLKTNFDESIEDISYLELGKLKYLCDTSNISLSSSDYSSLVFYRDCRNKLAHTAVLSEDEMIRISKRGY